MNDLGDAKRLITLHERSYQYRIFIGESVVFYQHCGFLCHILSLIYQVTIVERHLPY